MYKNIRNSAWLCLNDFGICALPVDVMKIAKDAGVKMVRNSDVGVLEGDELAKAIEIDGKYTVIYDNSIPTKSIRFSIAHELGHIFLGHKTAKIKYSGIGYFKQTATAEKQADCFAMRLLCPACIIWALELNTPEEISKYCRVELSVAEIRHERMKLLKKRGKFLTHPAETELFERFESYIADERKKRGL